MQHLTHISCGYRRRVFLSVYFSINLLVYELPAIKPLIALLCMVYKLVNHISSLYLCSVSFIQICPSKIAFLFVLELERRQSSESVPVDSPEPQDGIGTLFSLIPIYQSKLFSISKKFLFLSLLCFNLPLYLLHVRRDVFTIMS